MGEAKRRGNLQQRITDSLARDEIDEHKKKYEREYLLNRVFVRDNKKYGTYKKEK